MRDFRFGFNVFDVPSREVFVERCRAAERFGYDVVLVPDHLGCPAPFATAAAAHRGDRGHGAAARRPARRHRGARRTYQVKDALPGTFRLGTADQAEERVRFFREHAGERAGQVESSVLIQAVVVTGDRRAAAEEIVARLPGFTVEEALETPFLLIGSEAEIAALLVERRERFGYSYITVNGPYMEKLGPVIERLR